MIHSFQSSVKSGEDITTSVRRRLPVFLPFIVSVCDPQRETERKINSFHPATSRNPTTADPDSSKKHNAILFGYFSRRQIFGPSKLENGCLLPVSDRIAVAASTTIRRINRTHMMIVG
jgi:hypothetical protein